MLLGLTYSIHGISQKKRTHVTFQLSPVSDMYDSLRPHMLQQRWKHALQHSDRYAASGVHCHVKLYRAFTHDDRFANRYATRCPYRFANRSSYVYTVKFTVFKPVVAPIARIKHVWFLRSDRRHARCVNALATGMTTGLQSIWTLIGWLYIYGVDVTC